MSNTGIADRRDVARAIDALRRGWPVVIDEAGAALTLLAIETADAGRLAGFAPDGRYDVLVSPERAATLMLANQRPAAQAPAAVRIAQVPWLDLDKATALADPARDLSSPMKGPFATRATGADGAAAAALKLARLAGILPAFFVRDGEGGSDTPRPSAAAIFDYDAPSHLVIASRARLPVAASRQHTDIIAFRSAEEATEHVALVIGAPNGRPPLVRLHSECLTGDVFGSLKCDCGPQLDGALHRIAEEGWGILLYLRQEGRGIGLINKLRAYALQDQGFDTVDANLRLGFGIDERDFGVAARMLALIGQTRIRLLTNNPAKVAGLAAAGIDIVERVEHRVTANPHNVDYLATKRDRTGHML
ncbi:GTP cyclohydrolase II [Sphingomonas oryzagri]|uniref:GTP cyclohydrolase-2 n=1 Tax=Sphingomonas oryzagri TaxID=3042314 RepID=A0ABT6N552_9SPHN|nr:GTP cyclohydrolase II [Sphingomonas oryzagri]MDH7640239.1 GTP cyclohydrolase II [Sphingomonas oryzagri]